MFFYHEDMCINLDKVSSFRKHARNGKFEIIFISNQHLSNTITFIGERERELAWLSIIQSKIKKLDVCFFDSINEKNSIDADINNG